MQKPANSGGYLSRKAVLWVPGSWSEPVGDLMVIYVSTAPGTGLSQRPPLASCAFAPGLAWTWPQPSVPPQLRRRGQSVQSTGGQDEHALFVKNNIACQF